MSSNPFKNGRFLPAPGTEYPFSISDIARAAAQLIGDDWDADADAGCRGASGVMESADGDFYLVKVGDTGKTNEELYVECDVDRRILPNLGPGNALELLADAVAITVRTMQHDDDAAEPWDVGQHLMAACAARGRRTAVDPHSAGTCIVLAGHNQGEITISGASRTGGDVCVDYAPEDHERWTAVLRHGEDTTLVYESPVMPGDFAEDTAALLYAVLPYAVSA
ncbi:hypothetical protein ACGFYQ_33820 [Streptomyces sp. NPDC048258]|uniref:hypothetical protein n=1 Tax=Streptomyces sp. NPDC048258 TaxID=3365527 RepID=UPI00371C9908